MDLQDVVALAIAPALLLLPPGMDGRQARVQLLANGLQESRFQFRRQMAGGPARGFWQFEKGSRLSRGGVWGVSLHPASQNPLRQLCDARGVRFDPDAIYAALDTDDVLAAGLARLLMWTDPAPLPRIGDSNGAWQFYLRTWRPGKPHPQTWPGLYARALAQVAA